MTLHTQNGFEYDSEKPGRLSFVLRYAGDNPKYNIIGLEYKPKSIIKTQVTLRCRENIAHGSATLLYSNDVFLDKPKNIRYLESDTSMQIVINSSTRLIKKHHSEVDIYKTEPQISLRRDISKEIEVHEEVLLSKNLMEIYRVNRVFLKSSLHNFWMKESKYLQGYGRDIQLYFCTYLEGYVRNIIMEKSKILEYKRSSLTMWMGKNVTLQREYHGDIDISQSKGVLREDELSLIFKTQTWGLKGNNLRGLDKSQGINVYGENLRYIDKTSRVIGFKGDNLKYLDKSNKALGLKRDNFKYLDKPISLLLKNINLRKLNKDPSILLKPSHSPKNIYLDAPKTVKRENIYRLLKSSISQGLKQSNTFNILKAKVTRFLKYNPIYRITKKSERYISRLNFFRFDKMIVNKFFKNPSIYTLLKKECNRFMDKVSIFHLLKYKKFSLSKSITFPIHKERINYLSKMNSIPIYCDTQRGINKTLPLPIYSAHNLESLKVIKRWWVVPRGTEFDSKILPADYDYEKYPLVGSYGLGYERVIIPDGDSSIILNNTIDKMKLKYFKNTGLATSYDYIPKVYDVHPNYGNPYMEHDDRGRGLYEISLAINIMMEMLNLIGLIVHHQASQLCYCTGQEAMWFIMEMLDDWLTMDSTIDQLNNLGVTEQYHRAYRWIRWEAEKIYFDDRANSRFTGLKAGGQLLANLIEYIKHHHYNIVPMWPDLDKMDYWNTNIHSPTNDLLSKLKGKRHLNIEAQKIDQGLRKFN